VDFRDAMKHKGVDFFEVAGPFLMETLHKYEEVMRAVAEKPKIRIVSFGKVPFFDPSDLHLLQAFHEKCQRDKISLILLGMQAQPFKMIKEKGLYDSIGPKNFVGNTEEAEKRVLQILSK